MNDQVLDASDSCAAMDGDVSRLPVVDCDVHPMVPALDMLYPYLPQYRQDAFEQQMRPDYEPNYHPPKSPIAVRPDARRAEPMDGGTTWTLGASSADGRAATVPGDLCADVLGPGRADVAVLQCLYGVQAIHQPQTERELSHALNCWLAEKWLDVDSRLRGSIVVPSGSPSAAAAEIDRWAEDRRFVQVLLVGQVEIPYGRDIYWPIWEAAERAGLPVSIHLGGLGRNPPTPVGWPSTYLEWYVGQAGTMEAQLTSLISEGVFQKFPGTNVVIAEAGFAWLPAFMWKLTTLWKAYRSDIPWVDRDPSDLLREHVRLTTGPSDGIEAPGRLDTFVERVGSEDMLVYSSDYPHWHSTEPDAISQGTDSAQLVERIRRVNPCHLYGFVAEDGLVGGNQGAVIA